MYNKTQLRIRSKTRRYTFQAPDHSGFNSLFTWYFTKKVFKQLNSMIPLFMVIGTIFSNIIIFIYLSNIHQTSILPDIYSQSSSLLSIVFVSIIYLLGLFVFCAAPYLLYLYWQTSKITPRYLFTIQEQNFTTHIRTSPFLHLFFLPNLIVLMTILISVYDKDSYLSKLSLQNQVIPFIALYMLFYIFSHLTNEWKKINKIIDKLDFFIFLLISTLIPLIYLLTSLFYLYMVVTWLDTKQTMPVYIAVCLLLFFPFINPILLVTVSYFVSRQKTTTLKNHFQIIILPVLIASFLCYILIIFTPNIAEKLLYPVNFIEYPKNSSWYLVNNPFQKADGTQEISGIQFNDLLAIKKNFMPNSLICHKLENRNNALYGYMAWNLGSTKVFCPETVKFTDNDERNKQLSKQCLLIDGKYLQILDEQYITPNQTP